MRIEDRIAQELREWSRRPLTLSGAEAARNVGARLGAQGLPPRRLALRPALAAALVVLALLVGLQIGLRGRGARRAEAGTTAAFSLSSGTQVVIELREVRR